MPPTAARAPALEALLAIRYRLPRVGGEVNWQPLGRRQCPTIPLDPICVQNGNLISVVDLLEMAAHRHLEAHPDHEAVIVDVLLSARKSERTDVRLKVQVYVAQPGQD